MLVIRFSRVGRHNHAQYRIIVQEKTQAPNKKRLAIVGSYDPHSKQTILKEDEIKKYLDNGAQPSDSVYNLLVKNDIIKGEKRTVKLPSPSAEATEDEGKEEIDDAKVASDEEKSEEKDGDETEKKEEVKEEKTEEVKEEKKEEIKEEKKEKVKEGKKESDSADEATPDKEKTEEKKDDKKEDVKEDVKKEEKFEEKK